jgi:predicted permease
LHPSLPIAALGIALTLLSLLSFSIIPAAIFMRSSTKHAAGSRAKIAGISQTARQRWRSNSLLCAQVSLSLVLSTLSACFGATLMHWETVDVGMDREHILSIHEDMGRYAHFAGGLPAFFHQIQERLEAVPGVRSAAVEMCGSLHCGWITAIYVHGRNGLTNAEVHGQEDHVGPRYFETVGIPILRGRDFSYADTEKSQSVAIVSRSYARKLFGNDDPIGQWIGYEPVPNDRKFLIVGEVADARVNGPQLEAPSVVYMSIDQNPAAVHSIKVRAIGNPLELTGSVREALHSVAPLLTIQEIAPLSLELNGDLGTEKLFTRLAGIYASLALLLVAIGFYGVMSSRTARRRSEFGIRLAVGASRSQIQMLIVGQTARILFAGVLPGAVLSFIAVRTASHFLYGSVSANSLAIIAASVVLTLAGCIATLIPARRAAFADPLETLRSE